MQFSKLNNKYTSQLREHAQLTHKWGYTQNELSKLPLEKCKGFKTNPVTKPDCVCYKTHCTINYML